MEISRFARNDSALILNREEESAMAYPDLHEHIKNLEACGFLRRIPQVINKDTEMHPLVRWQYRGGIPEEERKAWLFENVLDVKGRRYKFPVVVGALAGNKDIYLL